MPDAFALLLLVGALLALILLITVVLAVRSVVVKVLKFLEKIFDKTGSLEEVKHLERSLQAVGGNLKKRRKRIGARLIMLGKQEISKKAIGQKK